MDYKSYVGNPKHYDLIGKIVFDLLLKYGLKPEHKLLDIGCGSLRIGKLIINYLDYMNYFAIEPNEWLIREYEEKNNELLNMNLDCNSDFNIRFKIKFDFILANSIFIHACKRQIEKCFDEVNTVLQDNGKFIFSYIEGKDNEKSEWSYPSAVTYSKNYIEDLINKYNFKFRYLDIKYPGRQKFILVKRG
jgi:cyclopropane fatty-acyl-phospholipid synthase-like methyltransferase